MVTGNMRIMILGYDAYDSLYPFYTCGDDTISISRMVHTWYGEPILLDVPDCCDAVLLLPESIMDATGISEQAPYVSDAMIGPNPFTTIVHCTANDFDKIKVYDAAGLFVCEWPIFPGDNVLGTAKLPSGVYFFKYKRTGITLKLVKVD